MFFSGCERLANAEPGFAEAVAKLDRLLGEGGRGLLDPGDVAVILREERADIEALFQRATDEMIGLFVEIKMVVCDQCGGLNDYETVETEIAEVGESDCTRCTRPIDLNRTRIVPRYRLSESAAEEASQLEKRPKRSVLILTALGEEQTAVLAHLEDQREEVIEGTVYIRGRFASAMNVWTATAAQIGAGNPNAAAGTMKALLDLKPTPEVALFVGIAGGLKDEVQKGDVVAAEKVHGYEPGKAGEQFQLRPDQMLGSYALVQRAQVVARTGLWLHRIIDLPDGENPKALVAEIASGEKVVTSMESSLYQKLRASFDRCVAVEMEGIGFLRAAHIIPTSVVLVIRGISDMVENKTQTDKAGWQVRAATNAAAFAYELLATL
jgi:nucleoside phosphorylase